MKVSTCLMATLLIGAALTRAVASDFPDAQKHIIVVGRNGEPKRPEITREKDASGEWKYHVVLNPFVSGVRGEGGYDQYIKNIADAAHGKRLMIHIHGGMNAVSGAVIGAAERIGKWREQAPGFEKLDAEGYPLFICWDSPFTGYGEQALWVRAGKTERYSRRQGWLWSLATSPLELVADLGRGVTRMPAEIANFAYNDLHTAMPGLFTEYKLMGEEIAHLNSPQAPQPHVTANQPRKPARSSMRAVSNLLLFPVRSATLPLIDAVGVRAWDNMLRHTETMFDRVNTDGRGQMTPIQKLVDEDRTGAISQLMKALGDADRKREITMACHSMGAIIGNRILVENSNLTFRRIIYMAAACSLRDFNICVVPYLQHHSTAQFYALSLHPKCESGEIAFSPGKAEVDLAPRGSLLVWIDNIFGNPPSENLRRFGIYQTAIIASHNVPPEVRSRVAYKAFNCGDPDIRNGLVWQPQHHGDFSNAPFWLSELWQQPTAAKTK